jgi:hypothetical protein
MNPKITDKMLENAHKITYLISVYPEKQLSEIINLIQLPAIQINAGIWTAVELGYVSEPNEETGITAVLSPPDPYNFGEYEQELEASLIYCFSKLLKKEQDMEENYLSGWTNGYGSHDTIIAMKQLLSNHILAEYEIEDGENVYKFYTNYDTREQLWGKKQFKLPPKTDKIKRNKKKEQ